MSLNVNYVTGNMASARLSLLMKWTPHMDSEVAAEYSRTAAKRDELWLTFRSGLQDKRLGDVALNLGYEREKQYRAEVSLNNHAVKNFHLSLLHSRSRLLFDENEYQRQNSSRFSLVYTHRLFDMAADYSFHRTCCRTAARARRASR